jgi:hypothetical protein
MLLWMELVFARESHFAQPSMGEGGGEKQLRFNCKLSRSHMFGEKGFKLTTTRRTGLVLETCLSLLTLTFVAYIRD